MGWSDFDKLITLMWKQAAGKGSKGKGKGKGGQGGQGGSQGGGKAKGKGKHATVANPDLMCKCCGKNGHVKSDCRHKDKPCDNCGKTGHLKAVAGYQ